MYLEHTGTRAWGYVGHVGHTGKGHMGTRAHKHMGMWGTKASESDASVRTNRAPTTTDVGFRFIDAQGHTDTREQGCQIKHPQQLRYSGFSFVDAKY
jgi:hypothetical protein